MEIKTFWVDIENSSGTRYGPGPLIPAYFKTSGPLSRLGDFSFPVPSTDANLTVLAKKRIAMCRYVDAAGDLQVFGGGVIDKIDWQDHEDGTVTIEVSGNSLATEMTYQSVGELSLASGGSGVADGPEKIMAFAPSGWSITDGTTLTDVYAGFEGESVAAALIMVSEHIGEHWRLGSGREVVWLGPQSSFEKSGVRAVQTVYDPSNLGSNIALIQSMEEIEETYDLITRAIPVGSGNGAAVVTLAHATDSPPAGFTLNKAGNYVKYDAGEADGLIIERRIEFKEIGPLENTSADIEAAANFLLQATVEHLRKYAVAQKFYKLKLVTNQLLQPGTTLRVIKRDVLDGAVLRDVNADLVILSVTNQVDESGLHTVEVEVSTIDRYPVTDDSFLAGQAQSAKVFSSHPQLGVGTTVYNWRDEMDKDHSAAFRFWLGNEFTSINHAILRFRIRPLRSTVKSVASESESTEDGGGSAPTSDYKGAHGHTVGVTAGSLGYTHDLAVDIVGSAAVLRAKGYTGGTAVISTGGNPGDHRHTVTIPNHSHIFTPSVSAKYGIFEESSANTLGLSDLVIKLNSGSDLSGSVSDIGGGWYQLDITAELVDSVYRPAAESNTIEISTAAEKTARIEAQLNLVAVLQAVKYT